MVEGQRRPKMQARPAAHGTKVLIHAVFVEHIPLHAAKGLEWERVFLMGANVGLLPLETNGFTLDARMIEEERRLFYVGMTRAKRELRISYRGKPSPFLAQAGLLTS